MPVNWDLFHHCSIFVDKYKKYHKESIKISSEEFFVSSNTSSLIKNILNPKHTYNKIQNRLKHFMAAQLPILVTTMLPTPGFKNRTAIGIKPLQRYHESLKIAAWLYKALAAFVSMPGVGAREEGGGAVAIWVKDSACTRPRPDPFPIAKQRTALSLTIRYHKNIDSF